MTEIEKIIDYAKVLDVVEVYPPSYTFAAKDSVYYGLPEIPNSSWIMRVYNNGKNLDIVNSAFLSYDYTVMTAEAKPYNLFSNCVQHLQSIVHTIHRLELNAKEHLEKNRLNKIKEDFNDD